jgi:hypothetical protein
MAIFSGALLVFAATSSHATDMKRGDPKVAISSIRCALQVNLTNIRDIKKYQALEASSSALFERKYKYIAFKNYVPYLANDKQYYFFKECRNIEGVRTDLSKRSGIFRNEIAVLGRVASQKEIAAALENARDDDPNAALFK